MTLEYNTLGSRSVDTRTTQAAIETKVNRPGFLGGSGL